MKTEALICVVEPELSIRKAINQLFRSKHYAIESHVSAKSFLDRKAHAGPCCVVIDVEVAGLNGVPLLQILSKDRRTEQIIFVSGHGDVSLCAQAFKAGAFDFLTKPLKGNEILQTVEEGLFHSKHLFRLRQERQTARVLLDKLTPREQEVLGFVIAGRPNKMIAAELGTTEKTIKKHRGHLMKKLQVGSLAELIYFSLQAGLKPVRPYGTKVPYTGVT